jgi:hypothetical protein
MTQKTVALGQDVSHPFSLGFALCYEAIAHQFCKDVQRVDELVETAITISTEQGFVLRLGIATVLRGWVLVKQGKAEEGIVQMHQGLADYKAISVNLSRPYLLALQAEVYGDMERSSEGLILLDEAMSLVEKGDLRHYEAELFRLKGELLLKYPAIFQGTSLYEFWFISRIKFRTMFETPVYYFLKQHVVGLLGR